MQGITHRHFYFFLLFVPFFITSCATTGSRYSQYRLPGSIDYASYDPQTFTSRLPQQISMGREKVVVVDPSSHAWGAYNPDGTLLRGGVATAGGDSCEGEVGSCRTATGTFRIGARQGETCYSKKYPKPYGGGLMPYCQFFHGGQALHGSPDNIVVDNNISHGCVRMRIQDAEWLYSNFATTGTKVVVLPYNKPYSAPNPDDQTKAL